MCASRQLEIVIKTIFDGRPDGVLGPGPEPGHGLGHYVRRGMAQDCAAGSEDAVMTLTLAPSGKRQTGLARPR